ncbi:TetR/AcrR family transcriptional regulator [Paenibacillus solisilvae]|uniref:TetR/AcrR family transcriptional regulator n=1 Tax=Paenibacillus solisilvae TaxID=2486751 RepID=A0ABW0VVS4_9BACL
MITSTKEKILNATLELIKAEGIEGVTIRKIAGLAGANIALINYYFGSKEKLISETLKIQLDSFREAFTVLDEKELPPLARLKKFILEYTFSLQEHPELVKRLLGQDSLFESQTEYVRFFKRQGFEKINAVLTEITGEINRETTLLMMQQIFAAILSPVVKASFAQKHEASDDLDFYPSASVEEQIDLFFDHYFYKYTAH